MSELRVPAGKMRHEITIQSVTRSRTEDGGFEETWTAVETVWAEIQPLTAREFVSGNQIVQNVTHRVRLRHYPGLTPSHRLVHESRTFNIHSVINANERERFMELLVKEDLNAG